MNGLAKVLVVMFSVTFAHVVMANEFLQTHVDVIHPQLLQPTQQGQSTSARLTIVNHTGKRLVIEGIHCDGFGQAMLHVIKYQGGIQKMMPVKRIIIPNEKQLSLTPNKAHFMLMKPNRSFSVGDIVKMDVLTNQGDFFILLDVVPHTIK